MLRLCKHKLNLLGYHIFKNDILNFFTRKKLFRRKIQLNIDFNQSVTTFGDMLISQKKETFILKSSR